MRQLLLLSAILITIVDCGVVNDISSEMIFQETDSIAVPAGTLLPQDISSRDGYPDIGKWMYQKDMQKAHWLGVLYEGKNLIEPINVIFVDSISKTKTESIETLFKNMEMAGYTDQPHHSSGYLGYIGGFFYTQLPSDETHAFSDGTADKENNHGRIFGPRRAEGKYIYIAAFSRETVDPADKIRHRFNSFTRARDDLTLCLDQKSNYKLAGPLNLDNAIVNDTANTTAEHDSMAVVVSLSR